ncbi:MAG: ABC transporter ATP-binding protein [Acidimicrobiia bacterium]
MSREYEGGVPALVDIDLDIHAGEYLALMGASGSGKTTLLNLLGLIDKPTGGSLFLDGQDTVDWPDRRRAQRRAEMISFIFQAFHLFDDRTVSENIEIGLIHQRIPVRDRRSRVTTAISAVGLDDRVNALARTLSGGEQQRTSIARAIARRPKVLLCDEPVGNLDRDNAERVLDAIDAIHDSNVTVIMVTHDPMTAERSERIVQLSNGRIEQ